MRGVDPQREDRAFAFAGDLGLVKARCAQDEQGPAVLPAQRAGERRHRCRNTMGDLAPLEDAHHRGTERVREQDPALGVECAPVGGGALDPSPLPSRTEGRVSANLERLICAAKALPDDQGPAVGRDHGTVRELQAARRYLDWAVGSHEREVGGTELGAVVEVESEVT